MSAWRRYIWIHAALLLAFGLFSLYALFMAPLLPENNLHCLLHDVLNLYCPLCGGTRAFRALMHGDVWQMLRLNAAVPLVAAVAIVLDVRALVLLLDHSTRALLPRVWWRVALVFLFLFAAVRNALMLGGIDPAGDLSPLWEGRLSSARAVLCAILFVVLALALSALCGVWESARTLPSLWAVLAVLVALSALLTAWWWLFASYLPLGLWVFFAERRRAGK